MKRFAFVLGLSLIAPIAASAQAPSPQANEQFLQQAVQALRAQREQEADIAATAQANLSQVQAENAKLKAQIADLQKQLSAKTDAPHPPVAPAPKKPVE